jgi:hypothetical protein
MVPNTIRVPASSEFVFPHGALCLGVEAATDFERRGQSDDQARDKDSGQRLWVATVIDPDPEAVRFGRSAETKVRIAADHLPVLPPAQHVGVPPLVEFLDITLTPYVDQRRCKSTARCGCRLTYSVRATGLVAATLASAP